MAGLKLALQETAAGLARAPTASADHPESRRYRVRRGRTKNSTRASNRGSMASALTGWAISACRKQNRRRVWRIRDSTLTAEIFPSRAEIVTVTVPPSPGCQQTIDSEKYFLDIDKVQRYPITFVVKTTDSAKVLREALRAQALRKYRIDAVDADAEAVAVSSPVVSAVVVPGRVVVDSPVVLAVTCQRSRVTGRAGVRGRGAARRRRPRARRPSWPR